MSGAIEFLRAVVAEHGDGPLRVHAHHGGSLLVCWEIAGRDRALRDPRMQGRGVDVKALLILLVLFRQRQPWPSSPRASAWSLR